MCFHFTIFWIYTHTNNRGTCLFYVCQLEDNNKVVQLCVCLLLHVHLYNRCNNTPHFWDKFQSSIKNVKDQTISGKVCVCPLSFSGYVIGQKVTQTVSLVLWAQLSASWLLTFSLGLAMLPSVEIEELLVCSLAFLPFQCPQVGCLCPWQSWPPTFPCHLHPTFLIWNAVFLLSFCFFLSQKKEYVSKWKDWGRQAALLKSAGKLSLWFHCCSLNTETFYKHEVTSHHLQNCWMRQSQNQAL